MQKINSKNSPAQKENSDDKCTATKKARLQEDKDAAMSADSDSDSSGAAEVVDTPSPKKKRPWEALSPLQTPTPFKITKKRKKNLTAKESEHRELVQQTLMLSLRTMEGKVLKQLNLLKEDLLGEFVSDAVVAAVQDKLIATITEVEEANSPLVQALVMKIFPQVVSIVEGCVNSRIGSAALNQETEGGAVGETAPGDKGRFKTVKDAEDNSSTLFEICDR